jgi:hypothetical protein
MSLLIGDRRLGLANRGEVIEDPEAAALGGDDEIVVLDHQVGDRHHRQLELQRLPVAAVIPGHGDAGLRPRVEQALARGILPHHAHEGVFGQAGRALDPGLAVVVGDVHKRAEVVELVAVRRQVGRGWIVG